MNTRTNITLDARLIDELMAELPVKTKAKAVLTVIQDFLKRRKMERIKRWRGKVEFVLEAKEIRALNDRSTRHHH